VNNEAGKREEQTEAKMTKKGRLLLTSLKMEHLEMYSRKEETKTRPMFFWLGRVRRLVELAE
jgi:hypothetical protein